MRNAFGKPSRATVCRLMAGVFTMAPAALCAQELRGTVFEADSITPASGAVVILLHATRDDSIIARTVTGERGLFALRAAGATTARLRVLRIGYQPVTVGSYALAAGEVRTVRVTLSSARITLAAVDVRAKGRCEVRPDGAGPLAQLFEEARKALLSSSSAVTGTRVATQFVNYQRMEDRDGQLTAPVERTTTIGPSTRPFVSVGADSLAEFGYVVPQPDGTTMYYAPDANTLLASSFLAQHCLFLVQGTGEKASSIGIGFRPVGAQRGLTDVRGTLWLDRTTAELQSLDYAYVPQRSDFDRAGVGGRVEYTRTAGGLWFVSRWAIRMPRVGFRTVSMLPGVPGAPLPTATVLVGLQIAGGEVALLRVDDEVLYANSGAASAGETPNDRLHVRRLAADIGARGDAPPRLCSMSTSQRVGVVHGHVFDSQHNTLAGARVNASWKQDFRVESSRDVSWQNQQLETASQADGTYRLCELPTSQAIQLLARKDARFSRVAIVELTESAPVAEVDLAVGMTPKPGSQTPPAALPAVPGKPGTP